MASSSPIQQWTPYLDIRGGLLEGPFYTPERNELRFVDLDYEKVYFLDLEQGPVSLRAVHTESPIGLHAKRNSVTADMIDDSGNNVQIVVAAKHGFATLDRQSGALSYIHRTHTSERDSYRMRFNDGAVDNQGRFWAGSSIDHKYVQGQHEGVLYRLDRDMSVHAMVRHMTTPNGMGWNDADDTMYITDSPHGKIYAYDFDARSGAISNRRDFRTWGQDEGEPDGFAMDVEGCLWVAMWRAGCVVRVNPHGEIVGKISLPTRFVTCPEFVGSELFVTTAMEQQPYEFPESARWGGKVYRVDVGVQGKPRNAFRRSI
ncbi:hypothetical protein UA08_08243 [Talaromyces atroroseus]|uniref:SMP-30/Gluconolactonase/LRE-like region domain-containing protein n=1 Tax=Talaromyces atroroseus TaxID=1441469 RepID=A0A225ALR0_TALAT|nr:hypothetical protein UA08_08243 [Talaromyces atroroseus]OKL56499.1 hypothetical protein UA08_08243 [Talaromyces atroroseus]